MRDYLHFFLNGKECRVSGADAFQPLSSYLRYQRGITGTKIVCEEGDCGACTVLIGRVKNGKLEYKPINSCIQYLYQVDLTHVITVEGMSSGDELNPVQESMVKCHGAQCGFCTPGFIMAMCSYFDEKKAPAVQEIKDCTTGNLCRCTGYEPILKAGMEVDVNAIIPLAKLYPATEMIKSLEGAASDSVSLTDEEQSVYIPSSMEDAVKYKSQNSDAVIISGGTDVCVNMNKRGFAPAKLMSLSNISGLNEITRSNGMLTVGSRVTLSELEDYFRDKVPEFHNILWVFGSPQIRNAGTLAGNIANASPIADTPPFLFIMDAVLEICGSKGSRQVRINDFYKGYKKMDMGADEFIKAIAIPMPQKDEIIKLYKVSRRKHLDISTNTAAFKIKLSGDKISEIAIAYGGVAAVILRLPKTEEFLKGKQLSLETMNKAAEIAVTEISPITDVRGSQAFRLQLARNLLLKLYYELAEGRVAV
jgi:xanthine dehydrogenase small subunit